jgi:hypothetical protein
MRAPCRRSTNPKSPLRRLVNLDALVRMKLNSFRDKDRMHLRDMIDVGLVDESWTEHLPETLSSRLQLLLDDPEG